MNFAIYYIEAMLACTVLFGILLVHNFFNVDRQEKQIKFDRVLIAFMLYFIGDSFWAAIATDMIPKTRLNMAIDSFALYILMAAIVYYWLEYAMAVEQAPNRNRPINRFAVLFPFLITTIVMIIHYIAAPQMFLSETNDTMPTYSVYLVVTPIIYLGAILFYTTSKAIHETNPVERRNHIFLGIFPMLTLIGGVIQTAFFPKNPLYCYLDTLLLLVFYIQSIESRVSLDPLTNLNNRGQLMRYISQRSNLYRENRLTIVLMMDINHFKKINDTYGHAEGDRALIITAEALKEVIKKLSMPSFLCRYGGDEFILIVHPVNRNVVEHLVRDIRNQLNQQCRVHKVPYTISIGIGFDELGTEPDSIQECIQRADKNLYLDKRSNQH